MQEDSAKKIFDTSQECISSLNKMLLELSAALDSDELLELRVSVAQAMGSLVDICEKHVYSNFEAMRPYTVVKKNQ